MNKKTFDKITPKDYDAFINVFENPEFRIGYIKSIQHGIFYSLWNFGKPFSYYNVPETVDMNIVEIVRKEIYKGNVRCK
ncbi:hypothetical protein [uncultured Arcobacter sp.]|uniref:hypothetical protein n=1 Tax=uncultured Arcobacter sp. TaxID=165434 RepID=UPI00261BF6A1|nr:hypothetical protein [uncultured Arcobacter sp.]